jgi:hypothetical protein
LPANNADIYYPGMEPTRTDLVTRVGLAALAVPAAIVGVWAAFLPRSFYDSFPGGGRSWVSVDGPYNQHLVRDVGQLNLGFALLLLIAAVATDRLLRRAALVAYLVPATLHFIYHASHLSLYSTGDAAGNVISLGLAVAVPASLLVLGGQRTAVKRT